MHMENHIGWEASVCISKSSPLASDFSEAILLLSEDGELKKLEDKWFSCSVTSCPGTNKVVDKGNLSLDGIWFLCLHNCYFDDHNAAIRIRSLPGYGCCTSAEVGVSLRERFATLWRAKLKRRNRLQLPGTLPVSHLR